MRAIALEDIPFPKGSPTTFTVVPAGTTLEIWEIGALSKAKDKAVKAWHRRLMKTRDLKLKSGHPDPTAGKVAIYWEGVVRLAPLSKLRELGVAG